MIVSVILTVLTGALNVIFFLLPTATLASIPFIGSTISSTLTSFILWMNAFIDTFPYAEIVWNLFIYGVIPFELALIAMRFFFGSRTPVNVE